MSEEKRECGSVLNRLLDQVRENGKKLDEIRASALAPVVEKRDEAGYAAAAMLREIDDLRAKVEAEKLRKDFYGIGRALYAMELDGRANAFLEFEKFRSGWKDGRLHGWIPYFGLNGDYTTSEDNALEVYKGGNGLYFVSFIEEKNPDPTRYKVVAPWMNGFTEADGKWIARLEAAGLVEKVTSKDDFEFATWLAIDVK